MSDVNLLNALRANLVNVEALGDEEGAEGLRARIAEAEAEEEDIVEGWDAYTVQELKDELRNRDLATSGNKEELVARLDESDAAEGEET